MTTENITLESLLNTLPQSGKVNWIGVRPGRLEPIEVLDSVIAKADFGLIGDRYTGKNGKRQVTMIQWEHLWVIASIMGVKTVDPATLRRNIAVSGINLLALKGQRFRIGQAILEYTGQCHPCSLMEQAFGPGGYNAVRGHGGITARVIQEGIIRLNDSVTKLGPEVLGSEPNTFSRSIGVRA